MCPNKKVEEDDTKVEEDSDDDVIIEEPEDDEPMQVRIEDTKLENLLSLPETSYKDKTHPFHEFFKDSRQLRKLLKTTESETERDAALKKVRDLFETFQKAHTSGPCGAADEPSSKKRRKN